MQVAQKAPPLPYYAVECVAGASVLGIQLKVLRQSTYPLGKQSHLDVDRPTIAFFKSKLGDDFRFLLFVHFYRLPN